ncbi:MAG: DUF4338 domain-containing protein [Bacteroidia bacterium]|nr:DUF4338 domain-containing protein [Bacteroidia bacterium]
MKTSFDLHTVSTQLPSGLQFDLRGRPLAEQVKLAIVRDLWNIGWTVNIDSGKFSIEPPAFYDKDTIKKSMEVKRLETIQNHQDWIRKYTFVAKRNLAYGEEALGSAIRPVIEVCEKPAQHRLFRILRYYWSSPYSDYVGRRIKLIIRDGALPQQPVIGIAALGSPIIHIPERDSFIGWDVKTRTENLIYAMDAYVIGALPPYNELLGGKLVSLILASNEVRSIYRDKYREQITLQNKRISNELAAIFTTSLYGRSSQYNRLTFNGKQVFQPIGETKGFGTLHLTSETIALMRAYLESIGVQIGNQFGDGPSWQMRLIRNAGEKLGFDSDFLLRHSFRRRIYYVPLAQNTLPLLKGEDTQLDYFNWPLEAIVDHWKSRWKSKRVQNQDVLNRVLEVSPENFNIL